MHELTDNQELWLLALESGDYEQAFGQLKDGNSFCCLGVACEISGLGTWLRKSDEVLGDSSNYRTDDGMYHSTLPPTLVAWLGLRSNSGSFRVNTEQAGPSDDLVYLNDDLTYDFAKIAKFIREHADEVFYDRSGPS